MKLKQNQSSIQQPTSEHNSSRRVVVYPGTVPAIGPKPPTPEAVAKAQFIDKTYQWKGSSANKAADVQPSV
jgi:hypothetical protein